MASYPPPSPPVAPPTYGQAAAFDPRMVPAPVRLHWAVVLILSALTRGIFGQIWLLVQANWIRRVTGRSGPMTWAIVNLCGIPFVFVTAILIGVAVAATGNGVSHDMQMVMEITAGTLMFTLYVVANFRVRAALQDKPIGLVLGPVMTFFFGPIYFQYVLQDYVLPDAAEMYGPLASAPAYVPPTSPTAPAA